MHPHINIQRHGNTHPVKLKSISNPISISICFYIAINKNIYIYSHPGVDRIWKFESILTRMGMFFLESDILSTPGRLYVYIYTQLYTYIDAFFHNSCLSILHDLRSHGIASSQISGSHDVPW